MNLEFVYTLVRRNGRSRHQQNLFNHPKINYGKKMDNEKQSSRKEISGPEFSYFELQAYWGGTKHYGGLKATEELIELCHINEGKYVLDVGCGVGATPCRIAKRYGCQVVGVDISERMIDWSKKRAKRESVEHRVEFRVADAQNLPFDDALFDAVICESVIAFVENKQKIIGEYVRVTKLGGYIGLTEATWIKSPPPTELVEYLSRVTGVKEILTSDSWKELLEISQLRDIEVRTYKINKVGQLINEMRQLGFRDFLKGWYKFLSLCIKSSAFRKYLKESWTYSRNIKNMFDYLGYGIYGGRK